MNQESLYLQTMGASKEYPQYAQERQAFADVIIPAIHSKIESMKSCADPSFIASCPQNNRRSERQSSDESAQEMATLSDSEDDEEEETAEIRVSQIGNENQVETASEVPYLITLDGEYDQVKLFLQENGILAANKDMGLLKLPAACSASLQANDVMAAFAILHKYLASVHFKFSSPTPAMEPSYMPKVRKILEGTHQEEAFLKFLEHLPNLLSVAYSRKNVIEGYEKTGLVGKRGLDMRAMFSQCPRWNKLVPREQDEVIRLTAELTHEIQTGKIQNYMGMVPELTLQEKFRALLGTPAASRNNNSAISSTSTAVSLWRAVLMSHRFFLPEIHRREQLENTGPAPSNSLTSAVTTPAIAADPATTPATANGTDTASVEPQKRKRGRPPANSTPDNEGGAVEKRTKTLPLVQCSFCSNSYQAKSKATKKLEKGWDACKYCDRCNTICCPNDTCQSSLTLHSYEKLGEVRMEMRSSLHLYGQM